MGDGRFIFSPLISSLSFRIEEIGKKRRETADLKLQEATWVISVCREVAAGGFRVGRWFSKTFKGRQFSLTCKSNRAGMFIEFDIFGSKRRLKTLIIPAGEGCSGFQRFSDALATTTAGLMRQSQEASEHHWVPIKAGGIMEGRSYAEAALRDKGGPQRPCQ